VVLFVRDALAWQFVGAARSAGGRVTASLERVEVDRVLAGRAPGIG